MIPLGDIGRDIGNYHVGFVALSNQKGVEVAEPSGSGTLVSVGSIQGILTAGHILTRIMHDDNNFAATVA